MNEPTRSARRAFTGRLIRVDVLEVDVGGRRARREIVRHPGAVAVWARAPDGRWLFVRQYRKAVGRALLEIVAGTREAGEPARACAVRELREETGFRARRWRRLGRVFTAPGFCTEAIDLFYADLSDAGAPAPDTDERVTPVLLDPSEWAARVRRGAVRDAKTLAAWALVQARGMTPGPGPRPLGRRGAGGAP